MSGLRRALFFTSIERYINMTVNFALIAAVSRLLTPVEIGVAAIGATIWAFVETLRDVPSSYLVQQPELTQEDIRTSFTVMAIISIALCIGLILSANWVAGLYADPKLATYLQILALSFLPGPLERPIMALFRRDMAFGNYAMINIASALTNAVVTVGLVLLGFSYMSFAWAMLIGSCLAACLAIYARPAFWIFKPHLGQWRRALRFGGYSSAYALASQLAELVPYLVLSRFRGFDAVGFYNRSLLVSQTPSKLLISGLTPVVFPALAAEVRRGGNLKEPFLGAVSHITVVYWPALVLMAFLAHPAVAILVGSQWFSIVPLVQVVSIAMLMHFAGMILIYPTLMALGALRDLLLSSLIALPITAGVSGIAAMYGPEPLVYSLLLTMPLQNIIGLEFVRRHVHFTWGEFGAAAVRSALVTLCTAIPPAIQVALAGFTFEMSIARGIALGFLSIGGWLVGLWLVKHPLRSELVLVIEIVARRVRKLVKGDKPQPEGGAV